MFGNLFALIAGSTLISVLCAFQLEPVALVMLSIPILISIVTFGFLYNSERVIPIMKPLELEEDCCCEPDDTCSQTPAPPPPPPPEKKVRKPCGCKKIKK